MRGGQVAQARSPRAIPHAGVALVAILLLIAIAFRAVELDRLPGVNGDETYYPVVLMNLRDGHTQSLTTNSGLPLNPLYAIPVYLLHVGTPALSFARVRWAALASGLLVLALAYPLLRRVTDPSTAFFATMLLACLPAAIAYSRFGWDQSQAPLISLICMYASLKRSSVGLAVSYALALWVHPLNAFLAPVLMGPASVRALFAWSSETDPQRRTRTRRVAALLAAIGALVVATLLLVQGAIADRRLAALAGLAQRSIDVVGWLEFLLLTGDFLNGITIYRYIAGEPSLAWLTAMRAAFWLVAFFLLTRLVPRWWKAREATKTGLLMGTLAALAAFYVVFGLGGLSPGYERYVMWLVVPASVLGGMLLAGLGDSQADRRRRLGLCLALCGLLLLSFYGNYFRVLADTGGSAARAFRTGPVEPKQAAFEAVVAASEGERAVTIIAEDWWSYFPIRYVAFDRAEIDVFLRDVNEVKKADLAEKRRWFVVGFTAGPFEHWIAEHAADTPRQSMPDPAGMPILHVWDFGSSTERVRALLAATAGSGTY